MKGEIRVEEVNFDTLNLRHKSCVSRVAWGQGIRRVFKVGSTFWIVIERANVNERYNTRSSMSSFLLKSGMTTWRTPGGSQKRQGWGMDNIWAWACHVVMRSLRS